MKIIPWFLVVTLTMSPALAAPPTGGTQPGALSAAGASSTTDTFPMCQANSGNCDGSAHSLVNGTYQTIFNGISALAGTFTNKTISSAFNTLIVGWNTITAGTNTAALVVGTGGSLSASGTGTITATALAAAGVPAVGQTLNTVQATKSASYELVAADRFTIIPVSQTTFATITFDQIASNYFPAGSTVLIVNAYTGTSAGITSFELINKAGSTSTFVDVSTSFGGIFLQPGQWARVTSDGTNYHVIIGGNGLPGHDIQSGTSVTLAQYDCFQVVYLTSASPVTVTGQTGLPSNCQIQMIRTGAGQAFFPQVASPSGGFSMFSLSSQTHDAGQYAGMTLTIAPGGTTGYLTGALSP